MRSRTTQRFRKQLAALPESVRKRAKAAFRQFQADPSLNSLRFKRIHSNLPIYSVRISQHYRAVGKQDERGMLWYWIGSHSDYDKVTAQPQAVPRA